MKGQQIDALVEEAEEIEAEEAQRAGMLGYMSRHLIQATMPHSRLDALSHERTNGFITVRLDASAKYGMPYGHYPRLILCWITTEAVRKKSRHLELGRNLSAFMDQLALVPHGGRCGSVTYLRQHMDRFFHTVFWLSEEKDGRVNEVGVLPAEARTLWWDPKQREQGELFHSEIWLHEPFFKALIDRPVPLDLRILRALARRRSSLGIDIYTWLTHRVSYLKEPMKRPIPWALIQKQMGGQYDRTRDFRTKFLKWLKVVQILYPHVQVEVIDPKTGRGGGGGGLVLKPCRPSVLPMLP